MMSELRTCSMRILNKYFQDPGKGHPPNVVLTLPGITKVSQNGGMRDRFLELLQASEIDVDYSELLYAYGVVDSRPAVEHLQKHWFGKGPDKSGEWFPEFQPIKPLFRAKMAEAFALAKAKNLPVVIYWVCPCDCVDLKVIETPTEISLFRFTPLPPQPGSSEKRS